MWKTILIVVLGAIGLLLAYAATRPDSFRVERSVLIKAPADKIYPFIADLKLMKTWNPWEKKDPAIKGQFGAIASGVGASYSWESDKVGTGTLSITEATEPSKAVFKLDFIKPFAAHNTGEYTLQPQADGTLVTWAMYGPSPYVSKVMGVFFSMDKMIGTDFEAGLADLKALAERS
jgi:Polyketide cyclase / dehydrase and lipid transport